LEAPVECRGFPFDERRGQGRPLAMTVPPLWRPAQPTRAVTGDVVESQDKGRGYQIGKDEYLPVEDEELDSLRLESTKIIDLEKFVPRFEFDERYLDSPYYLTPEDKAGQEAFAVIHEAMKRKNMVGLVESFSPGANELSC
jgi:Ku protein